MKYRNSLNLPCFFAAAAFACLPAFSNLAAPTNEKRVALHEESVEVKIVGDKAEVSGKFQFSVTRSYVDESEYELYLPVYANAGTKPEEISPTISKGGKPLVVEHVSKPPFKEIPKLTGQSPFWFRAVVSVEDMYAGTGKKLTIQIHYHQSLANGAFIYTPLIPKQHKSVDYGSISFTADRGMKLQSPKTHVFSEKGDKLIVEPHHARSIIVKMDSVIP